MAEWQVVLLGAYSIVVFIAFVRHFILSFATSKMRFLTPRCDKLIAADAPFVSIMVPAKDEEHGIEACLESLLEQDYPNYEVLVVDDRSTDRTAEIVRRLAARDQRLRLIQVQTLPPGWTGKTHALHLCQQSARGEWYLFVDADTRLDPSCVSVVLRDAIDHDVTLESVLPALHAKSFWERTIQPFAGICLMVLFPLSKVNRPKHTEMGFANGQFILIRKDGYEAIGGHEAVRDKFVEDIHLGRLVRKSGRNLRVVMTPELVSVRMYSSLGEIVRGWSRILYSAVDFKPAKLYGLLAAVLIFSVLSYVTILVSSVMLLSGDRSPFAWWLFGLAVAHEFLQTTIMARIYALSRSKQSYLAVRFLAVAVMIYILLRTIRMCRTHEVTWRGTTYGKNIQTVTAAPVPSEEPTPVS
jgi:glycosyltransferase involved in cell wall biosynthesis